MKKRENLFCCEFISHIIYEKYIYISISFRWGNGGVGYMVVCFFLFFTAGHITEAASKHQIHLFVRFVTAIFIML